MMNRSSLLAILACALFYMIYSQYLTSKYPRPTSAPPQQQQQSDAPAQTQENLTQPASPATIDTGDDTPTAQDEPAHRLDKSELQFGNAELQLQYSQDINGFTAIELLQYRQDSTANSANINLSPNALRIWNTVGLEPYPYSVKAKRNGNTLTSWYVKDGWHVSQEITFPERGYGLDITFRFKNIGTKDRELEATIGFEERVNYAQSSSGFLPGLPTNRPQIVSQVRGETEREDLEEFCRDEQDMIQRSRSSVEMFGYDRHYFISTMLIEDLRTATFRTMRLSSASDSCLMRLAASQRQGLVAAQEEVTIAARLYFGPKVLGELEAFDPRLGETLDLGWFSSISLLLLRIIKWLYLYVGNYGLAIIILTILIKILFYPLTHQSAVSMHKLKTLQPQMNELRERYKKNPREQQMKLMEFMRQHKVNPMKGCLPFLPQIPVFFAFYRVLSASVELRHAPFYGWIVDLSAKDPYYIAPILMGVSIFLQQRLTPMTGMDKNQQRIMLFMPIIFSVMMLSMPSGVVIYVLAQTIISVAQQQWITRRLAAANKKPNKTKGDTT